MGGETVGDATRPGSASPESPGAVLEMRTISAQGRVPLRLDPVQGECVSAMSPPGLAGNSVVPSTCAAAEGDCRIPNRPTTATPWTGGSIGYRGASGARRAEFAKLPGGGQGEDDYRDASSKGRVDVEGIRGLVQPVRGGSTQGNRSGGTLRSVLVAPAGWVKGDPGQFGGDLGAYHAGSMAGTNVEEGVFQPSQPGEWATGDGAGSSRGRTRGGIAVASSGDGSRGLTPAGAQGLRRSRSMGGGSAGGQASAQWDTTPDSGQRDDAMVGEEEGTRREAGRSDENFNIARQGQQDRKDSSAKKKVDTLVKSDRPDRVRAEDPPANRRNYQADHSDAKGPHQETQHLRRPLSEEGCRRERGGVPAVPRGCVESQAGKRGDGKVRGVSDRGGPAEEPGWIEHMIRRVRLPSFAYEAALPQYARFLTSTDEDAVLPGDRGGGYRSTSAGLNELPFAETVVGTVEPGDLRAWLTDEEWCAVEVLGSKDAFEERVLLPDVRHRVKTCKRSPRSRLNSKQVADLKRKGYIKRVRDIRFKCSGFVVVKSDRKYVRLIWNGVEFNKVCRPPPKFAISTMPVMLERLLRPGIRYYVVWDYMTWFVQLRVAIEVAKWFGISLDVGLWIVNGVPMGWSWACYIAQHLTIAILRRVIAELGLREGEYVAEVCIDNSILGMCTDRVSPERVQEVIRNVCEALGVRIKEGSLEQGTRVEWMVYELDCVTRKACFKKSFEKRLTEMTVVEGKDYKLREIWGMMGMILFASHAAMRPLSGMRRELSWMIEITSRASKPEGRRGDQGALDSKGSQEGPPAPESDGPSRTDWDSVSSIPTSIARAMEAEAVSLAGAIVAPLSRPTAFTAWIVADASTSGNDAYILFEPGLVTLVSFKGKGQLIWERELEVQLRALERAKKNNALAVVLSYGDNTTANAAARRGYALWCPEVDERLKGSMKAWWEVKRVGTERCVADVWTRRAADCEHKKVFTCAHGFSPGVICPCLRDVLMDWCPKGYEIGGGATIDAWIAEQSAEVPRRSPDVPFIVKVPKDEEKGERGACV